MVCPTQIMTSFGLGNVPIERFRKGLYNRCVSVRTPLLRSPALVGRPVQTLTTCANSHVRAFLLLLCIQAREKPMYILDARPLMNAGAQKIKGAGFESVCGGLSGEVYGRTVPLL